MTALSAREGYRLWAPLYQPETAVSYLENLVVSAVTPATTGRALADIGCGTGRRLAASGARFGVGVDLTPEMLSAASPGAATEHWIAGDLLALPLADDSFDIVWCRLVIGHVPDPAPAYVELARICRPGGIVIVSDFHPAAVAAGHRRTFTDPVGRVHELEHHVHPADRQREYGAAVGLEPCEEREGCVGPEIRPFYEAGGKMGAYGEQLGLPLVLVLVFRRSPSA